MISQYLIETRKYSILTLEEEKEFFIVIGVFENKDDIKLLKEECKNNIEEYYKECKDKWENITSIVNIKTPSLKTDYLINNDLSSKSSKNNKARELGVPIISEQTFLSQFK